ncbi:MAG: hypothetical protein ACRDXX_06825, partial [Stackebrandtia sp.]
MFRVITRGIRHRPGQSAVVLLLAALAIAAAVLTPAYTQAAQQSLLTDMLRSHPPQHVGVQLTSEMELLGQESQTVDGREIPGTVDYAERPALLSEHVAADDRLSLLTHPVEFVSTSATLTDARYSAQSSVLYRSAVCDHVDVVAGSCDTGRSEVLMSERSAREEGVEVGDTVRLTSDWDLDYSSEYVVAGIYTLPDPDAVYWGPDSPADHGRDAEGGEHLDALLTTAPESVEPVGARALAGVDYRLDVDRLRQSDVGALDAAIADLDEHDKLPGHSESGEHLPVEVKSAVPGLLKGVAQEQDAVAATVPLVSVPLVLLCWFVLYLAVSRLTEERGPELAVAKLRGHRAAALAGFGLGGVTALLLIGAPVGVGVGLAATETASRMTLADTAGAALRVGVVVY